MGVTRPAGVRLRIIDAFTDRPFSGNPAGVVLLDDEAWPAEEWMRQVAAELGLSETAFAYPVDAAGGTVANGGPAGWALRWFTPLVQDDLCGHATLAAAHAIATDTHALAASGETTIRFTTRSGVLTAHVATNGIITLDFPAAPPTPTMLPAGLAEALGATPLAVHGTGTLRDLLVVLPDEQAVRELAPDLSALSRITRREAIRGVTATARAAKAGCGYDFVSRFFSPADGIPEDPVTGSAHTALAPYWSARLGRIVLTGLQASARTGLVHTALTADRVHLSGQAITVLDGTLLPAPAPRNNSTP